MALTKITTSVIAANTLGTANIADNSIDATKIAANSILTRHIDDNQITGDQLADDITIAGNLTITGDLTTNGSTVTNSSTNTTIEDALIELGTGTSGAPATDAGIVIERGSSDNVFIGWDESADKVTVGTGSFTGASSGNLTITPAPFVSGALTASGLSYPTSDGTNGQVLKTDGSGALTFGDNTTKVDNYTATGDGSTTAFDTGINPGSEVNTWIFIDGVYQQKSQYSYSGSTVTFSTAPENGALIDVITGTSSNITASDTVLGVYEATTTNTDTYSTGISASNENNTWVFVGGVYQPKDSYTFSSGTLTFDANTPTGQKLSVVATKTITAGSVDTSTIAANAVTAAKIASNSILSRHIVNNSIVGADISATTQITANTFTGALTGNVTGNVAGNLTGTVLTAAQANITSLGTLSALTVSGQLTAGGIAYPTLDGSADQVLKTDGSGTLSFGTISGTTLNNNTNNYVMTGTGSANTLNGESGLTYDGSTLIVTGVTSIKNSATTPVRLQLNNTGSNDYASIYADTSSAYKDLIFNPNGGKVGIGTTSPDTTLDVTTGGIAGIILNQDTSNSAASARLFFKDSTRTNTIVNINGNLELRTDATIGVSSGTPRLVVNGNGNVGIGTASPLVKTHVHNGSDAKNIVLITGADTTSEYLGLGTESGIGYITSGSSSSDNTSLAFRYAASGVETEAMRINSSGQVKIHTPITNDFFGLSLQYNSSDTADFKVNQATGQIKIGGSNTGYYPTFWSNNTERMRVASNGKVGIGTGTTNPSTRLTVRNDDENVDNYILEIGNDLHATNTKDAWLKYVGGAATTDHSWTTGIQSDSYRIVQLGARATAPSSGTERMRITSGGSVLIGTSTTPAYPHKLVCSGSAISDGTVSFRDTDVSVGLANAVMSLGFTGDSDATSGYFIYMVDGNGAIGSIQAASGTSVSFNTTSDERLKKNIVDASPQLDIIKSIKVREFDWTRNDHHELGLIAQELVEIVPNVVTVGGEDETKNPYGVDYGKLTPYLIKAIQEQQTIIDDLKSRIETLEG